MNFSSCTRTVVFAQTKFSVIPIRSSQNEFPRFSRYRVSRRCTECLVAIARRNYSSENVLPIFLWLRSPGDFSGNLGLLATWLRNMVEEPLLSMRFLGFVTRRNDRRDFRGTIDTRFRDQFARSKRLSSMDRGCFRPRWSTNEWNNVAKVVSGCTMARESLVEFIVEKGKTGTESNLCYRMGRGD